MKFFKWFGSGSLAFFEGFCLFCVLGAGAFVNLRRFFFYRRQIAEQFYVVATGSIPVILLAATFTGMVIAAQAVDQMQNTLIPRFLIGAAFLKGVLVELGPVLTALILAGRIGAGISAELGTMKVSEQIDALHSLGLEPTGFLVMPRILAGFLILPVLNVISCGIAIFAGFLTVRIGMGLPFTVFAEGMRWIFQVGDVWESTLKAFSFGGFITWVACYFGLHCGPGAKGVGKATTSSVVVALVGILFIDYVIARIFPLLELLAQAI